MLAIAIDDTKRYGANRPVCNPSWRGRIVQRSGETPMGRNSNQWAKLSVTLRPSSWRNWALLRTAREAGRTFRHALFFVQSTCRVWTVVYHDCIVDLREVIGRCAQSSISQRHWRKSVVKTCRLRSKAQIVNRAAHAAPRRQRPTVMHQYIQRQFKWHRHYCDAMCDSVVSPSSRPHRRKSLHITVIRAEFTSTAAALRINFERI